MVYNLLQHHYPELGDASVNILEVYDVGHYKRIMMGLNITS